MVNKTKRSTLALFIVVFVALVLSFGCKVSDQSTTPSPGTTPTTPTTPETLFSDSGHADASSEAFTHWDEDDPALVPTGCAKCHSLGGFLDFVADGTVDNAADPGPFGCTLCHSDSTTGTTRAIDSVTFPSGGTVGGLTSEAICMQCHQGRYSKPEFDAYLAGQGAVGLDTVYTGLSFRNVHYFAAGATLYGTHALGGYQYDGMAYDGKFAHVNGYATCSTCHNPHSLEVKADECSDCHTGVSASGVTAASTGLHDIRHYGSMVDYDGDGNITEGIYWELVTMSEYLYNAQWSYAKNVCGVPIVYDTATYPYWFYDNNENGVADPEEAVYSNQFRKFTPRLLKAVYNYQFYKKDPGGFAHGGKYVMELLYDSLMDINNNNPSPVALPALHRGDEGHFDGSSEAFRHWDGEEVSASCAKCHSADGLPYFIENGENEETHVANGFMCSTCHDGQPSRTNIRKQELVKFPSGAELTMGDNSNICLNCHQGRESGISVDEKIGASSGPYSFSNIHYFPSAAVLFGSEAHGGYEYPRKSYAGRKMFLYHGGDYDSCIECHMGTKGADYGIAHNVMKPNPSDCVICHGRDVSQPHPGWDPAYFEFEAIRPASTPDYDGDGNVTESIKSEIQGLQEKLYQALKLESRRQGSPLAYSETIYPYFVKDLNGNGIVDGNEGTRSNGYSFTQNLLKAAYNYHTTVKEPNCFIHNSLYVAQLLVDSIEDINGDVSPYTWR